MALALFHPTLALNPWFYDLASILGNPLLAFTNIDMLEQADIDGILWYADVPFDRALYRQLIRKCTTVIWFVPRTTHYRFTVDAPPREPLRPIVEDRDLEEMKIIFTFNYPHLVRS